MAIEVGDTVILVFAPDFQAHGETYVVESLRTLNPSGLPYWVMSRNGREFIFDGPLILRKVE